MNVSTVWSSFLYPAFAILVNIQIVVQSVERTCLLLVAVLIINLHWLLIHYQLISLYEIISLQEPIQRSGYKCYKEVTAIHMPSQVWWAQPPAMGRKFRAGGGWLLPVFFLETQPIQTSIAGGVTWHELFTFMLNVRHRRLSDLICTDWNTMSQLTCRAAGFLPEMIATVACVCSISVPSMDGELGLVHEGRLSLSVTRLLCSSLKWDFSFYLSLNGQKIHFSCWDLTYGILCCSLNANALMWDSFSL